VEDSILLVLVEGIVVGTVVVLRRYLEDIEGIGVARRAVVGGSRSWLF